MRSRGHSLIELLIVATIIAIVLTMILCTLAKAIRVVRSFGHP